MGWLLLAAGAASRFGSNKLLAPMTNGKTVFEHAVANLRQTEWPILAVLPPRHTPLKYVAVDLGLATTECATAESGMGASLAWGVKQVPEHWSWLGVVLADMPVIHPGTLAALGKLAQDNHIVLPVYTTGPAGGEGFPPPSTGAISIPNAPPLEYTDYAESFWGHPVCFGREFFPSLACLTGDCGARKVVFANRSRIKHFYTDDAGILKDIDTPQDLADLNQIL